MPGAKPEPFVVYWQDWALAERLAQREGVDAADIDPDRTERMRDFQSLAAARAFAAGARGAWIERRIGLVWTGAPRYEWDWAQELVGDDDAAG